MTFRLRLGRIRPKIAGVLDDRFMIWFFAQLRPADDYHVSRWETVR